MWGWNDYDRSCSTLSRLILEWVTVFGGYTTKPARSTQPCIPLGSRNRVPASIGWSKGVNVTSAGWQVTLCDPIWHVSSRSSAVLVAQTAIRFLTLRLFVYVFRWFMRWRKCWRKLSRNSHISVPASVNWFLSTEVSTCILDFIATARDLIL